MSVQELTCINCPMGCTISVELERKEIRSVKGNTCRLGEEYARKEVISPERIVTTTVPVRGGIHPMVSVKTRAGIPKQKIFECVHALKGVSVQAPVTIGDIILPHVAGTEVDIVATRNVKAAE